MATNPREPTGYHRSWKTTLYAILAMQGLALAVGATIFGAVVTSQPPSIYPVFGYGKPPPIVIDGFNSFYWAFLGAVIGLAFAFVAMKSRQTTTMGLGKIVPSIGTTKRASDKQN